EGMDALGVFIIDREVIEDVAEVLGIGHASLPAAHADGADRVIAKAPIEHVEVVNVLLDDVVAANPGEVVPVAHLVNEVAPVLLPRPAPEHSLIPVAARADDVADR